MKALRIFGAIALLYILYLGIDWTVDYFNPTPAHAKDTGHGHTTYGPSKLERLCLVVPNDFEEMISVYVDERSCVFLTYKTDWGGITTRVYRSPKNAYYTIEWRFPSSKKKKEEEPAKEVKKEANPFETRYEAEGLY